MKKLRRTILKNYNKVIAYFLSILGLGGACSFGGCTYGPPDEEYEETYTYYKATGKVSSEDSTGIPGIRVTMKRDTSYTDENGQYQVEDTNYSDFNDYIIEYTDVDGDSNGLFQFKDTLISFHDIPFENGDGNAFLGEATQEINIILKEDN